MIFPGSQSKQASASTSRPKAIRLWLHFPFLTEKETACDPGPAQPFPLPWASEQRARDSGSRHNDREREKYIQAITCMGHWETISRFIPPHILCKNAWLSAGFQSWSLVLGKLSLNHRNLAQKAGMYSVKGKGSPTLHGTAEECPPGSRALSVSLYFC